jgi:hypothetical protein
MDDQSAESVRLRIVAAIGRDGLYITSADKERHFDGASFVAFYGGQLFLTLVTAAASQFWDKLKEEGAKKLVDVAWEKAAGTLKAFLGKGEVKIAPAVRGRIRISAFSASSMATDRSRTGKTISLPSRRQRETPIPHTISSARSIGSPTGRIFDKRAWIAMVLRRSFSVRAHHDHGPATYASRRAARLG